MSKSIDKVGALIIPADTPPLKESIKRQLLFFSSISLLHPDDKALINNGEVTEKFPNMTIQWSERAPFPRSDDYDSAYREILNETDRLQKKGIIRVLPPSMEHVIDPGINWSLYHATIANPDIVRSAIPDFHRSKSHVRIPDGVICGMTVSQSGFKSKYHLDCEKAYEIPGADEYWNNLSYLRIARALKSFRRAYAENLCPIVLDEVNSSISSMFELKQFSSNIQDCESQATLSIALDIVNPIELEARLKDITWDEVYDLS